MSRKKRIFELISSEFNPQFLNIEDESFMHNVPDGAETHFKLTIVAEKFTGLSKLARHRLINQLLSSELNSGLHALSLHLYTIEEWQSRGETSPNSPACKGGFRHG
ncbi:MAG: BolA family transcriptional regulator [Tatlockia sp.]|nr:BolA family transcriptional regulator [Tatlockia sp.]